MVKHEKCGVQVDQGERGGFLHFARRQPIGHFRGNYAYRGILEEQKGKRSVAFTQHPATSLSRIMPLSGQARNTDRVIYGSSGSGSWVPMHHASRVATSAVHANQALGKSAVRVDIAVMLEQESINSACSWLKDCVQNQRGVDKAASAARIDWTATASFQLDQDQSKTTQGPYVSSELS